jgi:transposase
LVVGLIKNSEERDRQIVEAYDEGYSQHAIASCLGFSQPYINKIVKRAREE